MRKVPNYFIKQKNIKLKIAKILLINMKSDKLKKKIWFTYKKNDKLSKKNF